MASNSNQPPVNGRPLASSSTAATYSGAPGGVKIGEVTSTAGGQTLVVGIYADAVAGGVKFWVQIESGTGDLRGFFLDVGAPGGPITKAGSASNNMNGTGMTFDYGVDIGSPGSNDIVTQATFTLLDLPSMDLSMLLDGAIFGIRATSVGLTGTSVKLIGSLDLPNVTVSIAPNGDVLENAPAAFTVSLSMPVDEDMLVTLSNGATVTIPKGSISVPYVDGTQGDDVIIDPSSISLTITAAVPQGETLISVVVDTDPAVVNVTDTIDPVTVKLSATPSTSEDGGSITYTARIEKSGGALVTTNNAITVTLTNGEVITIPAGASSANSAPVPVNRDDVWVEVDAIGNSIKTVVEANAGTPGAFENLTYDPTPVSTQVLVDVDPVTVGITNGNKRDPGEPAVFTITIDQPLDSPLLVTLSTGDKITIPAGQTQYIYTVEDPPFSITVKIESAVVTDKTFESLIISPDSATSTDPPPDDEHFPTLENNISHITIYFSAAAGSGLEAYDTKGGTSSGGQAGPDGLFTVKIDWLDADTDYKDLDDVWNEIYARLLELDPNLVGKPVLGVAIKAATSEQFYALDGDETPEPVPTHTVDGAPSTALVSAAGIDRVYTSDTDNDGRNDFFEPAGGYLLSGLVSMQDSSPV